VEILACLIGNSHYINTSF